jgi:hypothetical protein
LHPIGWGIGSRICSLGVQSDSEEFQETGDGRCLGVCLWQLGH